MSAVLPVRVGNPTAAWPSDDCCDLCSSTPVRTELDGDRMCQSCADKWCRSEGQAWEGDLVPLAHPMMQAELRDWNARYARLSDAELQAHSRNQRAFARNERARDRRVG